MVRPVATATSSISFRLQILVGVLRHYVVLLLQSPPKKQPKEAIREQLVVTYLIGLHTDAQPEGGHLSGRKYYVLHLLRLLYRLHITNQFHSRYLKPTTMGHSSKMARRRVTTSLPHLTPSQTLVLWTA